MNLNIFQIFRVLFFIILSSSAMTVNAASIAVSNAIASLTVTDIVNTSNPGDLASLSLSGSSGISFEMIDTSGNASTTSSFLTNPSAFVPLGIGQGLQQSALVSTQASGTGSAFNFLQTDGLIEIINSSLTDTFEISFSLDFSLSVLATVTDMILEDAVSIAQILLFDTAFNIDIDEFIGVDSVNGSSADFLADNLDFLLVIDPDSANQLILQVDSLASSQSIPEPSSILLFVLGLFLLGRQQRKVLQQRIDITRQKSQGLIGVPQALDYQY